MACKWLFCQLNMCNIFLPISLPLLSLLNLERHPGPGRDPPSSHLSGQSLRHSEGAAGEGRGKSRPVPWMPAWLVTLLVTTMPGFLPVCGVCL